jgi:putative oxidoreductase
MAGSKRDDVGKLVLRLAVGLLLLLHGIGKLSNGVGWMAGPLGALGLPAFVGYGAYVGEVIAPLLAIVGKWTRLAGLLIAINMTGAVVVARRDAAFSITQSGAWAIELEALFFAGGVLMLLFGAGRYSVSRGVGRSD